MTAGARMRRRQSAAMPSPFPPIADYAFLSDCHTGALVAPDGAIDWLCVPRFDSPSVFGTLLDRQAGSFRFGPFGINVPRRGSTSRGRTCCDDLEDADRWVIVRDALTIGPRRGVDLVDAAHAAAHRRGRRPHARARRRVPRGRGRDGAHLRAGVRLRQRTRRVDGSATTATADASRRRCDDLAARPTWRSALEGDRVRATARAETGRADLLCALLGRGAGRAAERRRGQRAVRREGRSSGALARPRAHPRSSLARSDPALGAAIKGLTYMPTGATVAALTTSLPETPGGERNWDYRYTWLRDSTFTLQALHYLNLDWEAEEFMQFVADLEPNEDGALQIMYGIDGRRDLTESMRDELPVTPARAPCGSATAPSTSARTTSSARRSTRSCCTPGAASGCRGGCGRSCRRRPSARTTSGASPTRASGRRAASPSTTSPRS